jgi:hypothetical protein
VWEGGEVTRTAARGGPQFQEVGDAAARLGSFPARLGFRVGAAGAMRLDTALLYDGSVRPCDEALLRGSVVLQVPNQAAVFQQMASGHHSGCHTHTDHTPGSPCTDHKANQACEQYG